MSACRIGDAARWSGNTFRPSGIGTLLSMPLARRWHRDRWRQSIALVGRQSGPKIEGDVTNGNCGLHFTVGPSGGVSSCRGMRYISTRGHAPIRDFAGVLLAGLAEDGGLYVPESWPHFLAADWRAMRGLPYHALAARLIHPFVGDAIPSAELAAPVL